MQAIANDDEGPEHEAILSANIRGSREEMASLLALPSASSGSGLGRGRERKSSASETRRQTQYAVPRKSPARSSSSAIWVARMR